MLEQTVVQAIPGEPEDCRRDEPAHHVQRVAAHHPRRGRARHLRPQAATERIFTGWYSKYVHQIFNTEMSVELVNIMSCQSNSS
jgi:hypothetical protein